MKVAEGTCFSAPLDKMAKIQGFIAMLEQKKFAGSEAGSADKRVDEGNRSRHPSLSISPMGFGPQNAFDAPALLVALGLPLSTKGPAYTAAMLASAIDSPELQCRMFTPFNNWSGSSLPFTVDSAMNVGENSHGARLLSRISLKYRPNVAMRRLEEQFLTAVRQTPGRPLVWLFSELSITLSRRLREMGVLMVREKTNCAKATSWRILVAEHERCKLPPFDAITPEILEKEAEEFAMTDAIFCPSPMVRLSLLEQGVPEAKLLPTSYGWEPGRLAGDGLALQPINGLTLVFVGRICVRKGAHTLLEAWAKAGINGRLVLAGSIDPVIRKYYGHLLSRPDVILPGFIDDVGSLYRSADWFIFPTLEEGGPQVTYEAASCGLPGLVSPMGAGAFTRHGKDGIVLDSVLADDWAALIASLPERRDEREIMAQSARRLADEFTWCKVGARRRAQLQRIVLPQ